MFENGQMIGYAKLQKGTVGLQAGGKDFAEVIVFETPAALSDFKKGEYALDAEASAVALKAGASAEARYRHGVAVFTHNNGGLMAAAAIGGQKFSFSPASR